MKNCKLVLKSRFAEFVVMAIFLLYIGCSMSESEVDKRQTNEVDPIKNSTIKVENFTSSGTQESIINAKQFAYNNLSIIRGTDEDDVLYGTDADDHIYANGGDDLVYGRDGDDEVRGNDGDDILYGESGDDFLQGDEGADTLYGEEGDDKLHGNAGNDLIYGSIGNDGLVGNEGNDTLYGEDGNDFLDGGTGNDKLYGGPGNDDMQGAEGGDDRFYGGPGNDEIRDGKGENDRIYPEDGDDLVVVWPLTGTNTRIYLTNGNDTVRVLVHPELLNGYGRAYLHPDNITGEKHIQIYNTDIDYTLTHVHYDADNYTNFYIKVDGILIYTLTIKYYTSDCSTHWIDFIE